MVKVVAMLRRCGVVAAVKVDVMFEVKVGGGRSHATQFGTAVEWKT